MGREAKTESIRLSMHMDTRNKHFLKAYIKLTEQSLDVTIYINVSMFTKDL